MKQKISLLAFSALLLASFFVPKKVISQEIDNTKCDHRYITVVNPVRNKKLWVDSSSTLLTNQYELLEKKELAATWLIQYDVLGDEELLSKLKNFSSKHELGVFLEVSEEFARDSKVIYPHGTAWANPKALLLSGYSRSERKKLIDRLFHQFREIFGNFPKSVGAWWIDSYSLDYIEKKYDIKAALIVADQRSTDNYGVWGQWWGVPYYPSKTNILTPAKDFRNMQELVVIQWAMRDLTEAYCDGPDCSNYSLQANDYLNRGLDINYFRKLVSVYQDCRNDVAQVTIGLEVGMEGASYSEEFGRQLEILDDIEHYRFVTMSEFFDLFSSVNRVNPAVVKLEDENSKWILTTDFRQNEVLGENLTYEQEYAFFDYYISDDSDFLNRRLESGGLTKKPNTEIFFLLIIAIVSALLIKNHKVIELFTGLLFALAAYFPILRSFTKYGWDVLFGPTIKNIIYFKILVTLLSIYIMVVLGKFLMKKVKSKVFQFFIPLSFGIDYLLSIIRYTFIEGKHLIGITLDPLRFFGIMYEVPATVALRTINLTFSEASSLLRFNWETIWNNIYIALFVYPIVHIILGFILWFSFAKMKGKLKAVALILLIVLFIMFIYTKFSEDPRVVIPI